MGIIDSSVFSFGLNERNGLWLDDMSWLKFFFGGWDNFLAGWYSFHLDEIVFGWI